MSFIHKEGASFQGHTKGIQGQGQGGGIEGEIEDQGQAPIEREGQDGDNQAQIGQVEEDQGAPNQAIVQVEGPANPLAKLQMAFGMMGPPANVKGIIPEVSGVRRARRIDAKLIESQRKIERLREEIAERERQIVAEVEVMSNLQAERNEALKF